MIRESKKIWLFCLCLASLSLAWCFHVPDEDWLLSSNESNTWNIDEEAEIQQAFNTFIDWINMISSNWDGIRNDERNNEETEMITETIDENIRIEETTKNEELISNEKVIDDESENQENQEIEEIGNTVE